MSAIKLHFQGHEKEFNISRQGNEFRVEWDGQPITCQLLQYDGTYFILQVTEPSGIRRQIHAAGSRNSEDRHLWVDGKSFHYRRLRRQRDGESIDSGSLAATIPAVVTQILVSPGDHVSMGEKLILLESMKMIIPIQAPHDGQVLALHCAVGDSVQAGIPLVELSRQTNDE